MAQSKPDLIDRAELLALIRDHADKVKDDAPLQHAVLAYWQTVVEALPAREAEPVTHCQNCEKWKDRACGHFSTTALSGMQVVTFLTRPDDYCSFADRRVENGIDIRG